MENITFMTIQKYMTYEKMFLFMQNVSFPSLQLDLKPPKSTHGSFISNGIILHNQLT